MKLRIILIGCCAILFCRFLWLSLNQRHVQAEQRVRSAATQASKSGITQRFVTIRPFHGKVLMLPAPSPQGLSAKNDFYCLSTPHGGYWKAPKLVGTGFKFGYTEDSDDYKYQILLIQKDGVVLSYQCGTQTRTGALKSIHLDWK